MQFLVAAAFLSSILAGQENLPGYTFEVLGKSDPLTFKLFRMNARGDYTIMANRVHGARLGGEIVRYPTSRDSLLWYSEVVCDISDSGLVLGTYNSSYDNRGLYLANRTILRRVRLAVQPIYSHFTGFVNKSGEVVFNARPKNLMGESQNCNGYMLRGDDIVPLAYQSANAQGSTVYDLADNGETCGDLLYGNVSRSGNLIVTRSSAAAWTKEGELVPLETMKGWGISCATSLLNKDLVLGWAEVGSKSITVLWKKGKPEVVDLMPGRTQMSALLLPNGEFVAEAFNGGARPESVRTFNGKWHTLASLTENFPKNARLEYVHDVASDGSLLIYGRQGEQITYFRLKPKS